jgi:RNA polymerase primary sigma factor
MVAAHRSAAQVAAPDNDQLRSYLAQAQRHDLLDRAGELALGRRIAAGRTAGEALAADGVPARERRRLAREVADGDRAREEFVVANLRLVVSVARRFQGRGLPLSDLVQEGNLGLLRAVEKFDPDKGFKFSTYATWWIRQAIQRGLASAGRTVRLPIHSGELLAAVQRVRMFIEADTGKRATITEIAELLDERVDRIRQVVRFEREVLSLDDTVAGDSGIQRSELVADPDVEPIADVVTARIAAAADVRPRLTRLTAREREVVERRYGLRGAPRERPEVAVELGVSAERVRQLEVGALRKMASPEASGFPARPNGHVHAQQPARSAR